MYSTGELLGLKLAIFDHFCEILVAYKRHTPLYIVGWGDNFDFWKMHTKPPIPYSGVKYISKKVQDTVLAEKLMFTKLR